MGSSYGIIQRGDKEEAGKTLSGPTKTARIVKPKVEGQGGRNGRGGWVGREERSGVWYSLAPPVR